MYQLMETLSGLYIPLSLQGICMKYTCMALEACGEGQAARYVHNAAIWAVQQLESSFAVLKRQTNTIGLRIEIKTVTGD